ncbi:MAG TPA: dihydroorotase [Burkholderiales bacterium]|nr:dihydroorotase [Burkholderiales bacterium]
MSELTITRPDDWHLHLRDGAALASVLPYTARQFARAIVMPNLRPPVTSVQAAREYRARILEALARANAKGGPEAPLVFAPLMTLYLTDNTSPVQIAEAAASGFVHAVKYYPAGATTNADSGVTRLDRAFPALEAMARHDVPLLVHGEVTDPGVDVFDRERVFIETVLAEIARRFPALRVVFEHITTREAAEYVSAAGPNVAATITAHHLLYNRNEIFRGGLRPHFYCLPVLKRESHRAALVHAATSGSAKFFLGTDSAPHPRGEKESACGCAGCFTAHAALELYAEAFERAGALDRLEAFASFNGPDFYRLPRNRTRLTLVREAWDAPAEIAFGDATLVPLRGGERLTWRLRTA